jgi:cytochrome P450
MQTDQADEVRASARRPRFDAGRRWRLAKRALTRRGVGLLRRIFPVFMVPRWAQRLLQRVTAKRAGLRLGAPLPRTVVVLDAKAVSQVLSDYTTFPVGPQYGTKMRETFGPFLLGLDYEEPADKDAKSYKEQIALVRAAVGRAAAGPLTEAARRAATAAIASTRNGGEINVVDLLQAAMTRFLDEYFGIPEIEGSAETLLRLNQHTASYVFNIELLNPTARQPAVDAGKRIKAHLVALFESKISQSTRSDKTFVDRLVKEGAPLPDRTPTRAPLGKEAAPLDMPSAWTPEQLATVAGGTISGLLVPTTAQFIAVVDHLLDLPPDDYDRLRATASVRAEAIARHSEDEDDGRLARYISEASRFEPFPAGLQRYSAVGTSDARRTLETGGRRRKLVQEDAIVMAMVAAAACDPRLAPQPGTFAIAREETEYMLFGTGQHHCVGATRHWPVAQTLMTELATALFSLRAIRRAPGARGLRTTPKGAQWPTSLVVTYDE